MTDAEWQKVYEMSQDKNLYQHLCTSLFPTIHGEWGCAQQCACAKLSFSF